MEFVNKYTPYIYFDKEEPFYPIRVGYSIIKKEGKAVSADTYLSFDAAKVKMIIEYQIYWHFDIQHLYELEHVWIYVGYDGEVVDAIGSSHGGSLRILMPDRSNLEDGTHIKVYSQPGKHAFCPIKEYFELVENVSTVTNELVGKDGLLVTQLFEEDIETTEEINQFVKDYMQKYRFTPTFSYTEYRIPEKMLMPWEELKAEIPQIIETDLKQMGLKGVKVWKRKN